MAEDSEAKIAENITITDEAVAIDGFVLPWWVAEGSIRVEEYEVGEGSEASFYGVTLTIFANDVTLPPFTPQRSSRVWEVLTRPGQDSRA